MAKIKIEYLGDLRMECTHVESGVKIMTDAPKDNGGKGMAFSPTDLFAASVATCMITLMGIQAKKLGFSIEGMSAEVEKEMIAAPVRKVGKLIIRVRCPHLPIAQMREKLEAAALQCPVYESIHPDVLKEVDFVWGI
jgi:uncharacterized OsmC-like protein